LTFVLVKPSGEERLAHEGGGDLGEFAQEAVEGLGFGLEVEAGLALEARTGAGAFEAGFDQGPLAEVDGTDGVALADLGVVVAGVAASFAGHARE
jgi:hypothetical protein